MSATKTRPVDGRLLERARGAFAPMGGVVAAGTVTAVLVLAQAVLLASVVNRVFLEGADLHAVRPQLVALAAIFVGRAAIAWLDQVFASRAAVTVKRGLRRDLMAAMLRHGGSRHLGGGSVVVEAVHGLDALDPYFSRYLPHLILSALVPLVGIIWVATIDGFSAIILLVTVPLLPVFMVLIGDLADQQTRKRWNRLRALGGSFQEMIRGMTVLRVFGRAHDWVDRLRSASNELRRETMATLRIAFLSALVLELVATISTALVAVAVGLRVVYSQLEFEPALAVLIIAPEIYAPVRRVAAEFHAAMEGAKAAEDAFTLIEEPASHTGTFPAPSAAVSRISLDAVDLELSGHVVLDGFSLEIEPRRLVALVGESGTGKTAVLRLLMGLVEPGSGCIKIGGVDLREIDRSTWWRQISYLPQEPFLRSASIRDNLLVADASADEDRLWDTLRTCELAEFVASLPAGLDTHVGEFARLLSSGQRRRLALARTLLRQAELVLVDEPTANVDPETREVLARVLRSLTIHSTVIAVVHEPELIELADDRVEVGGR